MISIGIQERENSGGAEGNRTPDLCSAIAALSHLSYSPVARVFTCGPCACQRGKSGEASLAAPARGPLGAFMRAILNVILLALDLYKYVIIAAAVMSWLIAFNVVNIRNDVVRSIWNTLVALTEPLLYRIRRYLPNTGGIDISPIVLFLLILLIEQIIILYIYPYVF
jgi:YggT family protein